MAGVFGLIGCISLCLSLALSTFIINNNNNNYYNTIEAIRPHIYLSYYRVLNKTN